MYKRGNRRVNGVKGMDEEHMGAIMVKKLQGFSGNNPSFAQTFNPKEIEIFSGINLGEIKHYVSRGGLVSYRPLHIANMGSIINEIVIGPKSPVSIHDLKMILIASGIDLSIHNINLSDSTYR